MEEIHADPIDSPLTKMLEGVLRTLEHHRDFDVEIHTDSEGQTLNYSMMNHPIVSAHYAGKVITDVNPGSLKLVRKLKTVYPPVPIEQNSLSQVSKTNPQTWRNSWTVHRFVQVTWAKH